MTQRSERSERTNATERSERTNVTERSERTSVTERVVKVPDVGEGVAEVELVDWHVRVGDDVEADQPIVDVMTDKATVEISSPVRGVVRWCAGETGDVVAVGSELVRIDTGGQSSGEQPARGRPTANDALAVAGDAATAEREESSPPFQEERASSSVDGRAADEEAADSDRRGVDPSTDVAPSREVTKMTEPPERRPHHDVAARPTASPAVRMRARQAGIDLRIVRGSGPADRVTHDDLDRYLADVTGGRARPASRAGDADGDVDRADGVPGGVTDTKLIGLRRRIAERMAESVSHIPHITYVDEIDLTLLEQLRSSINDEELEHRPRLTLLPFLMRAIVEGVRRFPQFNARFDDEANTLHTHRAVHIGVATQTPNGLVVPVVRHVERLDVFDIARSIERLSSAARDGSATAKELSGSTITITSLGALGGLVTTPIINRPEVAIVGVNKMQTRAVWDGAVFMPRKMMNLSSSFDHRIIDGWDAANFVQHLKHRLESPAPLMVGGATDG